LASPNVECEKRLRKQAFAQVRCDLDRRPRRTKLFVIGKAALPFHAVGIAHVRLVLIELAIGRRGVYNTSAVVIIVN
jgi:hypothetical protein